MLQVLLLFLGIFPFLILWPVRRRNPVFLFSIFNTFFSTSVSFGLDLAIDADALHALLLVITSATVAIYPITFFNYKTFYKTERIFLSRLSRRESDKSSKLAWPIAILSGFVCLVYYQVIVGYNLTMPMVTGMDLDFATMRLEAYAGEAYTLAGPVNQFKNTLLPISVFSILILYYLNQKFVALAISALLMLPFLGWALMGTGQRTFLFLAVMGLILYPSIINVKINPIYYGFLIGIFLFIFSYQSYAIGRLQDLSFDAALVQVLHRFTASNQISAIAGFRFVYEQEIRFGGEWFEILRGFVPGLRGSTLSNDVFSVLFGGRRGTSPVSMWTSFYHNVGLIFTPLFGIFLLKIFEGAHKLLRYLPLNRLSLMAYSFLCLYIMIAPLTNPFAIINNGLLGLVFLFSLNSIRISSASFKIKLS